MKKVLIINSNYYKVISQNLVINAKRKLILNKFSLSKIDVPGVFEIPIAIRNNIKKFDGFVALGCVIKGQTPHFNLICNSTFNAILKLAIDFNKPIGNGIITSFNLNQAIRRSKKSSIKMPNKGLEAANAVISILKNEPKKI
ncbi:MAG: 6,7-dimethyl-8-ribityllumazine synthase [Flavobacterium sp.]|jgi:6,7-dimethyl-8-ribityllumazine synthase|nr:6,7-dimethyl-8-ribityllumazine synthase [Flavobacterium sp.]